MEKWNEVEHILNTALWTPTMERIDTVELFGNLQVELNAYLPSAIDVIADNMQGCLSVRLVSLFF